MQGNDRTTRSHIARRMRMYRAHWNLTQAEAAAAAGLSLSSWSRWERGASTPPLREWQRLTALMDRADAPPVQAALEWGK
jgi:DNA-binding XRE family transcriptional regulator